MISILMCTYNRAYCLKEAIDSILGQTYKDFELIIMDDGSTDETEEVITSYKDSRIKYFKMEQNSYYCHAANCGLAKCSGDYVAFMNSDDAWLPDKLQKQVEFMEQHSEYGACFTTVSLMDEEGHDVTDQYPDVIEAFDTRFDSQKEYLYAFLESGNVLCHPSALIRKNILDQVGGFNLMYSQVADLDLWVRIITVAPIYVLQERLIRFRWKTAKNDQISSMTTANTIRTFNEQVMVIRDMIERMSDEQFIEFFGEKFKNKCSKSHLEIEYEKAFFLAECIGEAPDLKILGIYKMEQVLRMPGAMETLNEHFGMRIHDVYEWNKENVYNEPWLIAKLHKEHMEVVKELRADYENSSSWKITAPLRKIMSKNR